MDNQIPDDIKNLHEITAKEIRLLMDRNSVNINAKTIRGEALIELQNAIYIGLPVRVWHSFIEGNLILTMGNWVSIDQVEQIEPLRKDELLKMDIPQEEVCLIESSIAIEDRTYISGSIWADGVVFGDEISFSGTNILGSSSFAIATFCKSVNFSKTKFFNNVSFNAAKFSKRTYFNGTILNNETYFIGTRFGPRTDIENTTFMNNVYFDGAVFGEQTSFWGSTFSNDSSFYLTSFGEWLDFVHVKFKGSAVFTGHKEGKDKDGKITLTKNPVFKGKTEFHDVTIETPEKVRFQDVDLSRASFLETHIDKVQFIDVEWDKREGKKSLYDEREAKEEDYQLVAQLYRQLKKNYEDARDYPGAGDFHYGEMEMTRKMHWARGEYFNWFLTKAYKILSGYGENIKKAVFWTGVILLAPALIYCWFGATVGESGTLGFLDSLVRSLGYMTFRISQAPNEPWAKGLMFAQALIGPIQLALAALALRRKFKR